MKSDGTQFFTKDDHDREEQANRLRNQLSGRGGQRGRGFRGDRGQRDFFPTELRMA